MSNDFLTSNQNTTQLLLHIQEELNRVRTGADVAWINTNGFIIFFMQTGFCLLESGSSRYKSHMHTMMLQVINCIGAVLGWWILGYAFAYGVDRSGFIGAVYFAGDRIKDPVEIANWMFDFGSAATAAKIVSGAVLERIETMAYLIESIFITAFIYPVVLHWAWHPAGWLKKIGYIDHAGSGVVHMVGGACALSACLFIGPRLFRFEKKDETEEEAKKRKLYNHKNFEGNFLPFTIVGGLLLWYCWYGFNCGSSHAVVSTDDDDNSFGVGRVGVNTTISSMGGGLSVLIIHFIYCKLYNENHQRYNAAYVINGILGGAVGITAAANTVYPYAAFIIGFMAGAVYYTYHLLIDYFHIDDPLHAGPIHLGTGSFGVVAEGIFHTSKGFLYGGGGRLFGVQLLGMVCIFAWAFGLNCILLAILKWLNILRVPEEAEIKGNDLISNGGMMVLNLDEESIKYYARLFQEAMKYEQVEMRDKNNCKSDKALETLRGKETETDRYQLSSKEVNNGKGQLTTMNELIEKKENLFRNSNDQKNSTENNNSFQNHDHKNQNNNNV